VARAEDTGADIDVVALAAVRATREAMVARGREKLPSILGTPAASETSDGEAFDGTTEVATFPAICRSIRKNSLPAKRRFAAFQPPAPKRPISAFFAFVRPPLERERHRGGPPCLTSALTAPFQFLIGDRLQ